MLLIETINKLWERTELKDNHWLYLDTRGRYGKSKELDLYVHRLSLCVFLKLEYDDKSWMACHIDSICRYRNCWNPLHLYQGTPKENVFDRHKTGAWRNQYTNITHCKRGHEYTPENTRVFNGDRQCVMCKKAYDKERKLFEKRIRQERYNRYLVR